MSGWFDTIWADDLPSRAVTVYMYLRSRADREGKWVPSRFMRKKICRLG